TVVRCAVGQTEEFKVEVGLHQGSALSPFLFAIVMDQLSEEVRQESPCTMMFADDIVICSESREQVEENLERWRFALERRGMKVSRSKTEYMCVNEREGSGTVRLQGEEVKKVQEFKYLGSTVQGNGECGKEVKKRVQAESRRSARLVSSRLYPHDDDTASTSSTGSVGQISYRENPVKVFKRKTGPRKGGRASPNASSSSSDMSKSQNPSLSEFLKARKISPFRAPSSTVTPLSASAPGASTHMDPSGFSSGYSSSEEGYGRSSSPHSTTTSECVCVEGEKLRLIGRIKRKELFNKIKTSD
ncbi:hypothetical protein QTP86_034836, partial [Hemibagrus guttatus]